MRKAVVSLFVWLALNGAAWAHSVETPQHTLNILNSIERTSQAKLNKFAQLMITGVGTGGAGGGIAYQGIGNVASGARFYIGFRAYNAAYIGSKAASICDVATGAICSDVNIAANGYFDAAAAAALTQCSVSCNVATLYDQTGNGHDFTQSTNSQRPILTFNAIGSYACATFTSASSMVLVSNTSTLAPAWSFLGIGKRTANFTSSQALLQGNDGTVVARLGWPTSTNTAVFFANSASTQLSLTAANTSFHAMIGVDTATATENFYVDGSTTNSATTSTTMTGTYTLGGTNFLTARYMDGIVCEAAAYNSDLNASATALNTNMHAAYGGF